MVRPVACQPPRQTNTAQPQRRLPTAGNPSMSLPGMASKAIVTARRASHSLVRRSRRNSRSSPNSTDFQRSPRGLPEAAANSKNERSRSARHASKPARSFGPSGMRRRRRHHTPAASTMIDAATTAITKIHPMPNFLQRRTSWASGSHRDIISVLKGHEQRMEVRQWLNARKNYGGVITAK